MGATGCGVDSRGSDGWRSARGCGQNGGMSPFAKRLPPRSRSSRLRQALAPLPACWLLLACAGAPVPDAQAAPPSPPVAPTRDPAPLLASGRAAFEKSDYAAAEASLREAARARATPEVSLALAELLLITGRYEEAVQRGGMAARLPSLKVKAHPVTAEALRRQGKLDEALKLLSEVTSDPKALRASLLMGEILLAQGKVKEAEQSLMRLIEAYNDDQIADSDADGLALVGRAAHLLRAPRDANDAFNQAERAQKGHVPTLLWRAELFLEKYDPGHAEEVVNEVLAKAPNHPDALVWLAHVKLAQALDFDAATRLADQALGVNPKHAGAYFVKAGIELRDMELAAADKQADAGLAAVPGDLDLLSMKAAIRFLADDTAGFERAKQAVLSRSPRYSRMYQIIADYAEWEHRYDEVVHMMREALKLDGEDAKAEAQLGLNLIRGGEDAAGVKALGAAFDKDPFNVRVYNTLNLYEKKIPKEYVTLTQGAFTYRFHKDEQALLARYIPGLMEQALRAMMEHYQFTPGKPVGVELYSDKQDFSIRTSGLPDTGIQGVCFGKTLASMSPHREPFNLGMTLWHELAHVFHIQMSKSHVPRWFTEGLAEYETLVVRSEWQREHDDQLFAAMRDGRLPKLGHMNRAFTRAEEMSDIATAYYASSQILVMLAERYGRAKLNQMLTLWGQGVRTPEVVQRALGKDTEALDREFEAFSKQRLSRYQRQFVPISRSGPLEEAAKLAKQHPDSAPHQTRYALAALRAGDAKAAQGALEAALRADPKYPDARYLKAQVAAAGRDVKGAERQLRALIKDTDGYALRMSLARLMEAQGDPAKLKLELNAAHRLDPTQAEPLVHLLALATKEKDAAGELTLLRKLAALEQHSPEIYQRLMKRLLDAGELDEARRVGESAVWVDLAGLETHRLFGEILIASKMLPRAIFELHSALLCDGRPQELAAVHGLLAKAYAAVPNPKEAAKHRELAKGLKAK